MSQNGVQKQSESALVATLKSKLRTYPDFPKTGINFIDIFSIYSDWEASQTLNEILVRKGQSLKGEIDVVVGLDARGFLMGPTVALQANVPFVPVRKSGKLPGQTIKTSYSLEYGEAEVEIQCGAIPEGSRVVIVDDLLATGGTLNAACKLIQDLGRGISIQECYVVMELAFLKGRETIPSPVTSVIQFAD